MAGTFLANVTVTEEGTFYSISYAPLNTTGRMLLYYLQPLEGQSLKRFGVVLCIKAN